jgi:hypothetical protein
MYQFSTIKISLLFSINKTDIRHVKQMRPIQFAILVFEKTIENLPTALAQQSWGGSVPCSMFAVHGNFHSQQKNIGHPFSL